MELVKRSDNLFEEHEDSYGNTKGYINTNAPNTMMTWNGEFEVTSFHVEGVISLDISKGVRSAQEFYRTRNIVEVNGRFFITEEDYNAMYQVLEMQL
jgi:hypothetical protein